MSEKCAHLINQHSCPKISTVFIESPQKWDNSGYYVILQLSRRWYLNIENVNQIHEKQTLNFACNKHTNINSWIHKNIGLSHLSLQLVCIVSTFFPPWYKKPDMHPPKFTDFLRLSLHVQTPHTRYNYEIPKQPLVEPQNSISKTILRAQNLLLVSENHKISGTCTWCTLHTCNSLSSLQCILLCVFCYTTGSIAHCRPCFWLSNKETSSLYTDVSVLH